MYFAVSRRTALRLEIFIKIAWHFKQHNGFLFTHFWWSKALRTTFRRPAYRQVLAISVLCHATPFFSHISFSS
jgi:hypothetical protein